MLFTVALVKAGVFVYFVGLQLRDWVRKSFTLPRRAGMRQREADLWHFAEQSDMNATF